MKGGVAMNFANQQENAAPVRRFTSRIISFLLVFGMLCGLFAFIPGVTAETAEHCGKAYHEHTPECYQTVQTEAGEETLCVCGAEEHIHTLSCYADPTADLQTPQIWEQTLPEALSGNWAEDLAAVAASQLGYTESTANYLVAEDGQTLMGYNRYGAWYGSFTQDENQPYYDWNIPFLFFSIYYAGVEDFPLEESCADWVAALKQEELWQDGAGEYVPQAGALAFMDTDGDGTADRAGVVTAHDENQVTVVEGDSQGAVRAVTYETVLGYGDVALAQARTAETGESTPQPLSNTQVTLYFACWQDWSGFNVKANVKQGDNAWQKVDMSPTGQTYTYGANTYNVYSATVTELYGGFDIIQFQKYNGSSFDFEYEAVSSWTTKENLENKIYIPYENIWVSYSGGGGTTTTDIVDIAKKAFSPQENVLYVDASFYDYYTDYEIGGRNRDTNTTAYSASNESWMPFNTFNTALSSYYSGNNVKIPLYVGHFQPDWDGWGLPFSQTALASVLYGYKDVGVYGATYEDQKFFMAANNSYMDSGYPTGDLTRFAAQGLVNGSLSGGKVMSVKNSGGTVALPLFSESFLNGSHSSGKKLGEVYEKVSFPFTKDGDPDGDGVEYWEFDSDKTTLEMKQDTNTDDYFLEDVGKKDWAKNKDSANANVGTYGFFPFNATASAGNLNTYNYGFGARLDIPFRLTESGTVPGKNGDVPIVFQFSGDDDVWVFLDGKLVLDIGGTHGKVQGNINFKKNSNGKMQAWVENTKINPGTNNQGSNGPKTTEFTLTTANTDQHVLTLFYMERGMWESNMKISFNFPDENLLEVEKEVDTSDVNSIFADCFDDQKLFTFNIKNLATHYAPKANSVTYNPKAVTIAESMLSTSNPGNTLEYRATSADGSGTGKSNVAKWTAGISDSTSEYRHMRYGVIDMGEAVNIDNYSKLSFWLRYPDGDIPLDKLYIQLLDTRFTPHSDVSKDDPTFGDAYGIGCMGSASYLSGKTYGTPSTAANTWVKITLDLSKLTRYGNSQIRYIRFGCDNATSFYVSGFTFEPAVSTSSHVGFVTKQYDIPDYGSATSGTLMAPVGAAYTTTADSKTHAIGNDGTFVLENGETVYFHDQFRRGSYIALQEVLTAQEQALYDTTWTMFEDGEAVTAFGTGSTVTNPGSVPSMKNVAGTAVNDGRKEYKPSSSAMDAEGVVLQRSNNYNGSRPSGSSFVFRSYTSPDNTATATKLKVVYTNTVNTVDLTIKKLDKNAGTSNAISSSETFTFVVEFYNVGGIGLENSTITKTVTLKAGGSTTITGIPVNTSYTIYELKTNSDIVLDSVSGAHTAYTATTYNGQTAYQVAGSVGTGDKTVNFTNVKKPTISLTVTKQWKDGNGATLTDTPDTVYLCLLYKKTGASTWQPYVSPSGFTGYQKVAFTPGYGTWDYTFTPLDVYVNYRNDTTKWQYKVVELDPATFTQVTDQVTLDELQYRVTYSTPTTVANGGTSKQTITNTLDSATTFTVRKSWVYGDGVTPVTDFSLVPGSVTVQLWRQSAAEAAHSVATYTLQPGSGETWATYSHTFADLQKKDSRGNAYTYYIRELNGTSVLNSGATFTVDSDVFTVGYSDVTGNSDDGFQQTITNRYQPKTTFTVTKKWTRNGAGNPYTGTDIPGSVWVRLQRQLAGGSWVDMDREAEITADDGWSCIFLDLDATNSAGVAYNYRAVELTDFGGEVIPAGGKVTYNGVSFCVTYDGSTIYNRVEYTAAIDLTKLAADSDQPLSNVTFRLQKTDSTYTAVDVSFTPVTATTGSSGKLTFTGLTSGYYTLTETKTANGYLLLAEPLRIEVRVTGAGPCDVYVNGTKQTGSTANSITTCGLSVYNKPQLVMPATGGVWGFEFWILGGLCMISVPLLMYTFTGCQKGGKYLRKRSPARNRTNPNNRK